MAEISLNAENFFDYFEYKEVFKVYRNPFGELERADLSRNYALKDMYKLIDGCESTVAAKLKIDNYLAVYAIDFENETYTVETPGKFRDTCTIIKKITNKNTQMTFSMVSFYPDDDNFIDEYSIADLIDATGTLYISTNTGR